ncbi:MAG: hypothetical protein Q4B65_01625 [Candidatus Saccharibacteria bacterium]|nr:hypothetical protein [Candidatus Saccharibacteria bacterium]
MNSTFKLWTVLGSLINLILGNFALGWFRNRRRHCILVEDNYGEKPLRYATATSAAFLFGVALTIYGDNILLCLKQICSNTGCPEGLAHPVYWLFGFVSLCIALALFVLLQLAGHECGKKFFEMLAKKEQEKCLDNLEYNINCPFACENCPLAKTIKVKKVLLEETPEGIGLPIADVALLMKESYWYYKVTNYNVGKSANVFEQTGKDGSRYFVPFPTCKETKPLGKPKVKPEGKGEGITDATISDSKIDTTGSSDKKSDITGGDSEVIASGKIPPVGPIR